MSVVFFRRKQPLAGRSIDDLFDVVLELISDRVDCLNYTLPFPNTGVINRIKNMWYVRQNSGTVNHIIGDIHYLGIVLPRANTLLTIHDCGELQKQSGVKRFVLWLLWFYWPVKRLKFISVVSIATKKDLLKYVKVNEEKIRIIYNGLVGIYTRKKAPFNTIKPTILQIGDTPNKNLTRIITALENVSCRVLIVGEPNRNQIHLLREKSIDYSIVNNLSRTQIINLYQSCDLLLFPSTIEGFGLPIIEAQASGLPVVTGNITAMPEIAGDGACFVDPFDTTSIREGVLKVINDGNYRNELIEKGFINVQKFSAEAMADGYLELYESITGGIVETLRKKKLKTS